MHIAQFTNTYYPVISGVVRSVSAFRQALSKLGHNVFVFAQESEDYVDQEPFIFRYPSISLPMQSEFALAIPVSPFVDRLLPALHLDVIHAHHPFLIGRTAASKAEELDLPFVFTYHTQYRAYTHYFPIETELIQDLIKDVLENYLGDFMRRCHHVVVPSESMRQKLEEAYGLERGATVIPTGIDLTPYRKADGEQVRAERGWGNDLVLISVGRLAREKNWGLLLRAFARICRHRQDVRLALIGDGPDRERLERQALELEVADSVEFIGKLSFAEIPAYLKGADVFAFASVTETQGLVTMEAMAAGLPIVAVNATGTRDVVEHGVQGLLTEEDPEALASALDRILDDPGLRLQLRTAALERAKHFDIAYLAKRLVGVYEQAIEDKRAKRRVIVPERV